MVIERDKGRESGWKQSLLRTPEEVGVACALGSLLLNFEWKGGGGGGVVCVCVWVCVCVGGGQTPAISVG